MNLHEVKNEILLDYKSDFQLIGSIVIGEMKQKTGIRFKNVDGFETCFDAIVNGGYDRTM